MKTVIEKLLLLLGGCSENSNEATKLRLIANITQSPDYKKLSKAASLKTLFQEYYSLSVLETVDNNDLIYREELLHKVGSFYTQFIQCIRSGNGPELKAEDLPDFTSSRSVTQVLNKIIITNKNTNYTNIDEDNALKLFSDTTVRSAQECFGMLPVSLTNQEMISEEDIKTHMGNVFFCIPIDEFEEIHKNYLAFTEKSEQTIQKEKKRRKKHTLLKISIILLCFGAEFAFSQFGFFPEQFIRILYRVTMIVSIIFLIWG